ncbi:MAG: S-layer homology domain-containing protein [Thermodesulfovibrionales bacterium]|nr:S-layer homology domain-containing protein [Thermodesulfovibrionales bacterium]
MKKLSLITLLQMVILLFISGCAKKPVEKCLAPEDNAPHHYLMGMEALERGKTDTAIEKFERALYCDEKFSMAQSAMAIALAEKTRLQKDPKFRQIELERIEERLKKARKLMRSPEDQFDYNLAVMRVNTILKIDDWLNKVEDAYRDTMKLKVDERKMIYYQGTEAGHYFMGIAYLDALEFQKARDRFADVLNARREGKWHAPADRAWKKTDKIVRAMAGITIGDVGKKIAIKDAITRGDLAALLIDELKLDKLFAGRIPVRTEVEKLRPEFVPADIMDHPFKEEIITILKWKVRGLEPKYDETTKAYLFKPEDLVKRGEMAFILEDVLIKITGDERIATAYFGHERSPFPDVRPTSPLYNAVMNMTTRGIMEPELSGEFRIDDPVDGAEALLAIRVLKQRMNIY